MLHLRFVDQRSREGVSTLPHPYVRYVGLRSKRSSLAHGSFRGSLGPHLAFDERAYQCSYDDGIRQKLGIGPPCRKPALRAVNEGDAPPVSPVSNFWFLA